MNMNRFFKTFATVSAAAIAATAFVATPASAATITADNYDHAMLDAVNKERANAGLSPLQWYEPMHPKAVEQSMDMMAKNELFHDASQVNEYFELGCLGGGSENVQRINYNRSMSASDLDLNFSVQGYMNSPAHRASILDPNAKYFASGTVLDDQTGLYFNTQRFISGTCNGMFEVSGSGSANNGQTVNDTPSGSNTTNTPTNSTSTSGVRDVVNFNLVDTVGEGSVQQSYKVYSQPGAYVAGDWDGSGKDVPTIRRGNTFYTPAAILDPSLTLEVEAKASYGRDGDELLSGKWDGNASNDGVGVRRGNIFFLKNGLNGGDADIVTNYGRAGDQVYIGDWDGDGKDTPVVRRGNTFYFKNSWTSGAADYTISYGRAGDQVFIGDWDGDGKDTVMVKRFNNHFFKNSFSGGDADIVIPAGSTNDETIVGDWNGTGADSFGTVSAGTSR